MSSSARTAALGDFERLLHSRLSRRRSHAATRRAAASRARESRIDAVAELEHLRSDLGRGGPQQRSRVQLRVGRTARGRSCERSAAPVRRSGRESAGQCDSSRRGRIELRAGCGAIRCASRCRIRVPDCPGPLAAIARRSPTGPHGHGLSIARESARQLGGNTLRARRRRRREDRVHGAGAA